MRKHHQDTLHYSILSSFLHKQMWSRIILRAISLNFWAIGSSAPKKRPNKQWRSHFLLNYRFLKWISLLKKLKLTQNSRNWRSNNFRMKFFFSSFRWNYTLDDFILCYKMIRTDTLMDEQAYILHCVCHVIYWPFNLS